MKMFKTSLLAAMASVSAFGLGAATPAVSQDNQAGTPSIPIDVWALRDVVNAVDLSPDGKHLLVHKMVSKEGEYLLEIYKTDDLSEPYRRLNADPMEIISARWVSDSVIYGNTWQISRERVRGPEDDTRNYATYFYDLDDNKFQQVEGSFGIVNDLPNEPNKVLVSEASAVGEGLGVDPFEAFRPRSYYKLDLRRGTKELILRGTRKYGNVTFDNEGNPRYAVGQEPDNTVQTYYRKPGDGSWTQFGPVYDADEHENLYRFLTNVYGLKGFSAENPNIGYIVEARNGSDTASLWEFNFDTGQYGEELVAVKNADIMGIGTHSIPGNDKLAYATYPGAKWERVWFDGEEKALYDALEQQIPYAHQINISSRSYDGRTLVVTNRGPHDPGSYWLVRDGQLAKLGSRNPLIDQEQLADVEFIRYPSRDGKMIPGYVTKPKGEGPFPLIVLPHGGPHVSEVIGYDEWGQLLANAGYMVLQPGYRMTVGWGKEHFDAAYGQHGLAMQDDKDDGAMYLVEQGVVDPDRIAMFGWSYGGYAALVAASREPNIYQCTIAGAAVADPAKSYRGRSGPGTPKAIDDWAKRRGMIGINPIEEVQKVNIPLLMVHPEDDSRVLYYHFEDYKKAFEGAGKTGEFLTLEDADHFYTTLMYNHQQQFYTKMLDFLANDCGPGGL
ncbi:MAG: prolyl oligopeptidase family serine peptidase [Erythrobacter sp.]|uniref:alpha/beta hydrolase family protein n=1 Tax=Erythrobacter sp. TaxID=1042 RepID=UPI003C70CF48